MLIAYLIAGPVAAVATFAIALTLGFPVQLALFYGWLGGCLGVVAVAGWQLVAGLFKSRSKSLDRVTRAAKE